MISRILSRRWANGLSRLRAISLSTSRVSEETKLKQSEPREERHSEESDQKPTFADLFFQDCFNYLKILLPVAVVLFGLKYFFCVPIIGRSMSPQFNSGASDHSDTVIWMPRNPLSLSEPLKRGHIYLFTDPSGRRIEEGDTEYIVKRCIAIEGDTVMSQKNDQIVYNKVPEGHCWLESDNYTFQEGQYPDSLKFGPISNDLVWGRVVWCYRRNSIFPTAFPWPQNYTFNVPIKLALPHQRLMLSRTTINHLYKDIESYENLPNKLGMELLAKGPADHKMENMTPEEKQGWTYEHNFTLSTDIEFIKKLQKRKLEALVEDEVRSKIPGTPITKSRND